MSHHQYTPEFKDEAVRWAIAQIDPEGRPEAVRRRLAARKAAREEKM